MTADRVPVVDAGINLAPDATRAVIRFFVPGHEDVGPGDSRAAAVIDRICRLSDEAVASAMHDIDQRFDDRHPRLHETFEVHAALVSHGLDTPTSMGRTRRRLLGAAFSHEYAFEGASLCNPSIVAHPQQPADGSVEVVLSVRCIGEGHRSSIGFRTGRVDVNGRIAIDPPGRLPRTAAARPGLHHQAVLHRRLAEQHDDHENASYVLDPLPAHFGDDALRTRIDALNADAVMRRHTTTTIAHLEQLARCSYGVEFSPEADLSERVLMPHGPTESHGMEDARFVQITDGSAPRYCATYTAFDGVNISQNLLTTIDFVSFDVSPMAGPAARGKGLALFPRLVGGRHVALSRADRETNSIAYSTDLRCWDQSQTIQRPDRKWEIIQLGNCGSPIETGEGWLVLTHGVGPMRTYSIGALLLDIDEPHRVVAMTDEPVITPGRTGRQGYVPNVVYTCGALAVGDLLVLPYGVGDQTIAIATLSINDLLQVMRRT